MCKVAALSAEKYNKHTVGGIAKNQTILNKNDTTLHSETFQPALGYDNGSHNEKKVSNHKKNVYWTEKLNLCR